MIKKGILVAVLLIVTLVNSKYTDVSPLEESVKDQYIVVLDDTVAHSQLFETMNDFHIQQLNEIRIGDFHAILVKGDENNVNAMALNPSVRYIDINGIVSIQEEQCTIENAYSWGLSRVSDINLPLTNEFKYSNGTGKGVNVYVIDTGIFIEHQDFGGRASHGKNYVAGENSDDLNGHGTHVAGTIGGSSYGIAKEANIISVKMLNYDGKGSLADAVLGIEWAVNHANMEGKPGVINLSLGGVYYPTINEAIEKASQAGLVVVAAAGNEGDDSCSYSPASAKDAITVASSNIDDIRSDFSNYGDCVDLFAPGRGITSLSHKDSDGTADMDGTSMAAPHVAGVCAVILSLEPRLEPYQIKDVLLDKSTVQVNLNCGPSTFGCTTTPAHLLHMPCVISDLPEPTNFSVQKSILSLWVIILIGIVNVLI